MRKFLTSTILIWLIFALLSVSVGCVKNIHETDYITDSEKYTYEYIPVKTDKVSIIKMNGRSIKCKCFQGLYTSDDFLIRYATEEDIEKLNIKIDRTDDETVKKQPSVIFSLDSEEITLIKDSFTCSIRVNFSVIFEMEFEYINKDGKKYIIQTNHSDYLNLIKIPNSNKYLVEKGGFLFSLDPDRESLDFYCHVQTNGYSQLKSEYDVWASNPYFNDNGTVMIFYSGRADKETGKVWVKNIITGKENPVPNTTGYSRVLSWRDGRYAYITSPFGKVEEIDTVNLTSKVIHDTKIFSKDTLGFIYPYVFVPDMPGGTHIIDIDDDGEVYHFDDIKYAKCMEIERVNGSDLLLLKYLYPVSKNKWHSEAVVLDLSTRKICIISVPDEYSVSTFKQHNDCLMLSIYKPEDDIIIQTAYFIPISGIELVDSD